MIFNNGMLFFSFIVNKVMQELKYICMLKGVVKIILDKWFLIGILIKVWLVLLKTVIKSICEYMYKKIGFLIKKYLINVLFRIKRFFVWLTLNYKKNVKIIWFFENKIMVNICFYLIEVLFR